MGFSRQEYWRVLPFPSPGDLHETRDWTHISCISCNGRQIPYHSATWEAPQHWYAHHLSLLLTSTCSHEIKRRLLLGIITMRNLDSILKSRDITLLTKVHIVKAMVFPVVMYGCESWAIKKAEHWRIDTFKLWCWRRLLRAPWTARRPNQSILKEINRESSLMLKLKLQYFGHLIQRVDSLEKTLMLRRTGGRRRSKRQRMR